MKLTSFCFLAAVSLGVVGCSDAGTHYDVSPSEARSAIRAGKFPDFVFGTKSISALHKGLDDNTLDTVVKGPKNSEKIHFTTTVIPDGDGSKVSVEVIPSAGQQGLVTPSAQKEIAQEYVAAALERRRFNIKGFSISTIQFISYHNIQSNAASMQASSAELEEMQKQHDQDVAQAEFDREQRAKIASNNSNGY